MCPDVFGDEKISRINCSKESTIYTLDFIRQEKRVIFTHDKDFLIITSSTRDHLTLNIRFTEFTCEGYLFGNSKMTLAKLIKQNTTSLGTWQPSQGGISNFNFDTTSV